MADLANEDVFSLAATRLEKIAALKQKELLEETEYQEMRLQLLAQLKQAIKRDAETPEKSTEFSEQRYLQSPAYGQLHLEVVRKISNHYVSAEGDSKKRMFKAIAEMAERQVLHVGDSADIEEIIEIVVDPFFDSPNGVSPPTKEQILDKMLASLTALSTVDMRLRNKHNASPAAKAISEVTSSSAGKAAEEIRNKTEKPEPGLWKTLVQQDLDGALQGGAAAATIGPVYMASLPFSLPIFTAVGVVIGACIRSGTAYGEIGKK